MEGNVQQCLVKPQQYILRPYQKNAVNAALSFFQEKSKGNSLDNAIEVLPTGSGKSLIIANIVKELNESTIIFQPSKEILAQNYYKLLSYGYDASTYSASAGQKIISKATFATIGSVAKKTDLLKHFKYIIVDECHLVNSKGGMYKALFDDLGKIKILGLTATPYRLVSYQEGSILKFLTRTRPRVFGKVIYYIQNKELFDSSYLSPLEYKHVTGFDRKQLKINSTGADYTDESVREYYKESGFKDLVAEKAQKALSLRRNCLVFTRFIEEAEYVANNVPGCVLITGKTPGKERESIITRFKSGCIKGVCNVGVLTTGFDYPELETAIIARPTLSLALWYQMIGRIIRPHKSKKSAWVIDMCDNYDLFGKVEDLRMVDGGNGKWYIANNDKQLTNVYFDRDGQHEQPEQ